MKKSILTQAHRELPCFSSSPSPCWPYTSSRDVRVDRTVADDARRLTAIQEKVRFITLRAGMLAFDTSAEAAQNHARQMRDADTELLRLLAERPSTWKAR